MRELLMAALLLPTVAWAADSFDVYLHTVDNSPVHHSGPEFSPYEGPGPCFPYGCGAIEGPFKNPDPDARNPENLTACIYDSTGTLVYERKGKTCLKEM